MQIDTWIHQDLSHILVITDDGIINVHQFETEKYGLYRFSNCTDNSINNINTEIYKPVDATYTLSYYTVKPRTGSNSKHICTAKIPNHRVHFDDIKEAIQSSVNPKLYMNINIIDPNIIMEPGQFTITFFSDGGVKANKAGFGLVASIQEKIVLDNRFKLPQIYNEYTSHCSEALGVYSALNTFLAIVKFRTQINNSSSNTSSALFLCDNESVVKTVNKIQRHGTKTKDFLSPDFDVLNAINTVWSTLKQQSI
jgi:hypothetical protein